MRPLGSGNPVLGGEALDVLGLVHVVDEVSFVYDAYSKYLFKRAKVCEFEFRS